MIKDSGGTLEVLTNAQFIEKYGLELSRKYSQDIMKFSGSETSKVLRGFIFIVDSKKEIYGQGADHLETVQVLWKTVKKEAVDVHISKQ